jgi:hypothetical protein
MLYLQGLFRIRNQKRSIKENDINEVHSDHAAADEVHTSDSHVSKDIPTYALHDVFAPLTETTEFPNNMADFEFSSANKIRMGSKGGS